MICNARSRFSRSGIRARALRRAACISAKSIISAMCSCDYRASGPYVETLSQFPARATLLRERAMASIGDPSHLPRHPIENLDLARSQSAASENLANREHDMFRVVVGNKADRDQRLGEALEHRVADRCGHELGRAAVFDRRARRHHQLARYNLHTLRGV